MHWLEHAPRPISICHRDDELIHGHTMQVTVEYGSEDYAALLKIDAAGLDQRLAEFDMAMILDRNDPDLDYLVEYLGQGFARIVTVESASLPGLASVVGVIADKLAAGLTRGKARAFTCRCQTADGEVGIWRRLEVTTAPL